MNKNILALCLFVALTSACDDSARTTNTGMDADMPDVVMVDMDGGMDTGIDTMVEFDSAVEIDAGGDSMVDVDLGMDAGVDAFVEADTGVDTGVDLGMDAEADSYVPPVPVCGDGLVNQSSEECDDGNTISGDGCEDQCETTVWTCLDDNKVYNPINQTYPRICTDLGFDAFDADSGIISRFEQATWPATFGGGVLYGVTYNNGLFNFSRNGIIAGYARPCYHYTAPANVSLCLVANP